MRASTHVPMQAEVVEWVAEAPTIFSLRLRLVDAEARAAYQFAPGQFNMLYLYGVGEVPISIVSDPQDGELLRHTIRELGRVTRGLGRLRAGDRVGLRGPLGRGWPLDLARHRDVVVITGGLGCAPVVAAINFMVRRRSEFGHLTIVQGVKHCADLIWREQYGRWDALPDTTVLFAADVGNANWPWHVGRVTELFGQIELDPSRTIVFTCGPERMMQSAIEELLERGVQEQSVWLSMERNMQCGIGHCGHCQLGGRFVCRDGPVFRYTDIKQLFGVKGF